MGDSGDLRVLACCNALVIRLWAGSVECMIGVPGIAAMRPAGQADGGMLCFRPAGPGAAAAHEQGHEDAREGVLPAVFSECWVFALTAVPPPPHGMHRAPLTPLSLAPLPRPRPIPGGIPRWPRLAAAPSAATWPPPPRSAQGARGGARGGCTLAAADCCPCLLPLPAAPACCSALVRQFDPPGEARSLPENARANERLWHAIQAAPLQPTHAWRCANAYSGVRALYAPRRDRALEPRSAGIVAVPAAGGGCTCTCTK